MAWAAWSSAMMYKILGGFGSAACANLAWQIAITTAANASFVRDIREVPLVQSSGTDMKLPHAKATGKNEHAPEDSRMASDGTRRRLGVRVPRLCGCTGE